MSYLEILKRRRAEAGIGGSPATVAGEEGGAAKVGAEEGRSLPEVPSPGEPLPEHPRTFGSIVPKVERATAGPGLPDAVLTARYPLAALCRATLDANPAARDLKPDERRWIAEHLERAVLNWLRLCFEPESAWDATCPRGHRVTEGIFAKVLMGWCCGECRQVYPAGECKLRVRE